MRHSRAERKKVWRAFRNTNAVKQFAVYYYKLADTDEYAVKQDTSGSTTSLAQAFRLAAGHCAAAELLKGEYAKAIVIDRWKGHLVRVYTLRPGKQIEIKEL